MEQGRNKEQTAMIADAQLVKTTAGTCEEKGYEAGNKVKGRKRHLAADTQGNVMAVGVTAASVHDKVGVMSIKEDAKDH